VRDEDAFSREFEIGVVAAVYDRLRTLFTRGVNRAGE
jgi:hypothetical protein